MTKGVYTRTRFSLRKSSRRAAWTPTWDAPTQVVVRGVVEQFSGRIVA